MFSEARAESLALKRARSNSLGSSKSESVSPVKFLLATSNFTLQLNFPMKFGVVVFPGSNCDHDAWFAVSNNLGQQAEFIWHDATGVGDVDAVILPGGF